MLDGETRCRRDRGCVDKSFCKAARRHRRLECGVVTAWEGFCVVGLTELLRIIEDGGGRWLAYNPLSTSSYVDSSSF